MLPTQKILWGEGLFLRPQHFQQQDAYHEWRLAQYARALHPHAWGIRHIKIDADALQTGVLRILELQVIFPDGEMFNAPGEDQLPDPVQIQSCLPDTDVNEVVLHLALPPIRRHGSNYSTGRDDADLGVRYFKHHIEAPDAFTDAVSAELTVLQKSVRILADHEPRAHLVTVPALRLRRTASGQFEQDGRFIPPSLSLQASPALLLHLRRLLDILQAKVDALYGLHREPSKNIIEFRSGDVASFWLLHTASAASAGLSHFLRNPGLHPERLFQSLLELAGSLMTFSKTYTLSDLPSYEHHQPGQAFIKLDQIIRDLLETVISTRYFSVRLIEEQPSFHRARLDSEQIGNQTQLYLGVSASVPPAELVDMVPSRFKLGAPDDVDKLVLSAMPGVRLVHAPQVPAAIPVKPGAYYFTLDTRNPLYERMLQAQALTLYVPAGLPDLQLELVAVNA
ncbi:type VI secretion system baseplate subunit TssK [Aquabacterium sp.]|uniref:type VI secretion system baseplate subunit TssK n=1 Tax=Aquabacterium sp. TaxID=1872578 RepID=UPI0035AD87B3